MSGYYPRPPWFFHYRALRESIFGLYAFGRFIQWWSAEILIRAGLL